MTHTQLSEVLRPHLVELWESIPEAIIISEQGAVIHYINRAAEKLFGYCQQELLGKKIETLIPERYRSEHLHQRKVNDLSSDLKQHDRRKIIHGIKKDDTEFPVKITMGPLRLGERKFIISMIEDISTEIDFQDRFNLLSVLINETIDAVEVVDTITARFVDGNEAAWKSLGYTREEFLSLSVPDIDPIVNHAVFEKLIGELRVQHVMTLESIHKRKNGSTFPVAINIKYVKLDRDYLITVVRDMTELKKAQETIEYQAKYHEKTNLPNRNMLNDALEKMLAEKVKKNHVIALLIINIRHFKDVNYTIGHDSGDVLLKAFGRRVREQLTTHEMLFCLGGDEFAVVMDDNKTRIKAVAEKITRSLDKPFFIKNIPIVVEISIGMAFYPEHCATKEHLIQKAAIAEGCSKRHGGFVIYQSHLDDYNPEHLTLMAELHSALSQDELFLEYQPKASIKEQRLMGVEALIRWNNPRRGLLQPGQFIELAEKTALITALTLYTMENALAQCLEWKNQGMIIPVAVNMSPKSFLNKKFMRELILFLKYKVKKQIRFEFEITETTVMSNPDYAIEVINEVKSLGGAFAIDDFGKDYSSLNYLKLLQVDTLKIDRTFIENMLTNKSDAVIVETIINLAHGLGIDVVAEGVDNKELLHRLGELGCETVQGFHIAKPMSPVVFNEWLKESPFSVGE